MQGWQQELWHFTGEGGMTRLVVENRLINTLAFLRTRFPQLKAGLCRTPDAAKAFAEAGLKTYVVSGEKVSQLGVIARPWSQIAKSGLEQPQATSTPTTTTGKVH